MGLDPGESDPTQRPSGNRRWHLLTAADEGAPAQRGQGGMGCCVSCGSWKGHSGHRLLVKHIERLDPDSESETATWNLLEIFVCSTRRLTAWWRIPGKVEPCRQGQEATFLRELRNLGCAQASQVQVSIGHCPAAVQTNYHKVSGFHNRNLVSYGSVASQAQEKRGWFR